ncbi:carboxymuconolactone decarboxylase family protein [Pseudooceanicola sp. CBS1P-1]|uniref:Carboxymuconolactone decarboxylase family protein n=1 Tax=Pseudooceanicola albus TaxID=2692189 RepID=A0A6L7G9X1_9RHOB|nr:MULTISPECIES: carboxymuconolactone decarboxylase family protein [Pseudooceanicola]MBT9386455.1 carboxymuconolactone decarboxylase family protein [Pseudooceanicola endophyticus]MXN20387.1 carboxymuconolactone decarboxylase family protein [Pseudooceanicola albus]
MSTPWTDTLKDIQKNSALLKKANPEILEAFGAVREAAHHNAALDPKTRELIAIAVSVALHCKGCIASHTFQAKRAGATAEEVAAAAGTAMLIGIGSAYTQSIDVMKAYEEF